MKIGVFDSGIGGLTVVKSMLEHQLFEEIIYFGDTARVPYGIKDKNTIIRYAIEAVEFFKNFELDLIIVACNTVSAYALDEMRETSPCPVRSRYFRAGTILSGYRYGTARSTGQGISLWLRRCVQRTGGYGSLYPGV